MNKNSIGKNYIFSLTYQILNVVIQFITLPYLSRVLGAEGIGVQSYTNSIVMYFAMFGALGVNWYGQREIAKNYGSVEDMSHIFYELVVVKLISSGIVLPFYVVLILMSPTYGLCYLILLATFIASMIDISWFYQGIEKFDVIAIRNIIIKVVGTLSIFMFVKSDKDTVLYVFIIAASTLLGNISMWFQLKKILIPFQYDELAIKRHWGKVFHYFVPTVASSVYLMLDKSMIGIITKNEAENGYYEQTCQIVNMIKTVVLSYNSVMVSRMSMLFSQRKMKECSTCLKKSMSFIMGVSWPMTVGMICVAHNFTSWYFGSDYEKIAIMLMVFSPIVIFIGVSNMIESHITTPLGHRSVGNRIVIVGAIVNLVLNLILIPRYAAVGAAMSSVLAELVIAIGYQRSAKEYVTVGFILECSYKKIIAALGMALGICILTRNMTGGVLLTFTQVGIGGAIYFLILIILKDDFFQSFRYGK